MATDGVHKLNLILMHGQQKHNIHLELPGDDEAGNAITVEHLAKEAERVTTVPIKSQRLIFKGKSLTAMDSRLSQLGLKDASKVMLIGKKANAEDDANIQKLKTIESDVSKNAKKLDDISYELVSAERGYVQDNLKKDVLTKLSKRLAAVIEQFMKFLEKVDGIQFSENNSSQGRRLRRDLVDRIQCR
ncbi:BAG family molecular chaperone regulator 1-like isoform X2 [Tubulanus polymorphus]|uniref:BAG family molecular chaperone regulator 1-like isoform X2 n=1 Tax=Tubulanus polymorphus TaxID=672921 RepID=UPI003DA60D41